MEGKPIELNEEKSEKCGLHLFADTYEYKLHASFSVRRGKPVIDNDIDR